MQLLPVGLRTCDNQWQSRKHRNETTYAMASSDNPSEFDPPTESQEATPPVVIPYDQLDDETLRRVIEAYVLREGTEYGAHEVTLDHKVAQVLAQLHNGAATIAFHPDTESVDIVATRDTNGRRR